MNTIDSYCKDEGSDTFAMEVFDDPFDAFHPTLSDSRVTYNNLSTFPLFTLPRELRDIIYTDLLKTGQVKLAQVSKAVALDFMEIISKRGICRLEINESEFRPYPKLRKPLADTIQYLDLHFLTAMNKRNKGYSHDRRIEKIFSNSGIPRKSCYVLIENDASERPLSSLNVCYRQATLLEQTKSILLLTGLGGFETMTVKMNTRMACYVEPLTPEHAMIVAIGQDVMHWTLESSLKELFGDYITTKERERESLCLEFHPRAYREAQAQKSIVATLR